MYSHVSLKILKCGERNGIRKSRVWIGGLAPTQAALGCIKIHRFSLRVWSANMFTWYVYERQPLFSRCDNGVTTLPTRWPARFSRVRGNLLVFTDTCTANLPLPVPVPVPVHGNDVSQGLYYNFLNWISNAIWSLLSELSLKFFHRL